MFITSCFSLCSYFTTCPTIDMLLSLNQLHQDCSFPSIHSANLSKITRTVYSSVIGVWNRSCLRACLEVLFPIKKLAWIGFVIVLIFFFSSSSWLLEHQLMSSLEVIIIAAIMKCNLFLFSFVAFILVILTLTCCITWN